MTGDGGLVLMIFGGLALLMSLAERAISYHRWMETTIVTVLDPALRTAFPPSPPAHDLERLIVEAGAVLESQELSRQRQRRSHRRI